MYINPLTILVGRNTEHEQHHCKRKVRYGHKETAIKAAIAVGEKKGERFDTYECQYCGGWHIGHGWD